MCRSSYRYRDFEDRREYRAPDRPQRVAADDQRVADADRQRVIDQLQRHTADGRLTLDEFEGRVGEAWLARNHGELRAVLRELPVLHQPRPARPRRRRARGAPASPPRC